MQLLKLFDSESRIIRDYAWLETNFGKLVPTELIVRVPPSMQSEHIKSDQQEQHSETDPLAVAQSLRMLERVEAVSRIGTVIRRTLGETGLNVVGQTMSADTFLAPLPPPDNSWVTNQRGIYNQGLLEGRDVLLDSDYVRIEQTGPYQGSELWRVSLRLGALSDVDYGYFINTLRAAVEPVVRAYDTRDALIRQLATDDAGKISPRVSGKDKVLVIGAEQPDALDQVTVVDLEGIDAADVSPTTHVKRIDQESIYLATLSELLACEPIRTPSWKDPDSADNRIEVGSEIWNRMIGLFDVVVWVGGDAVTEDHLAGAKRLVDARQIQAKEVRPILVGDSIPSVEGAGNLQVVYTGIVPVVYKAQRTLLASLIRSIGLAFLLIAAVMIVLLNPGRLPFSWLKTANFGSGFASGMISMIPNAFPVLFVFGMMGHLGRLIDIGTMMTASVAMGVAVDDTIHFLSWFRANLDKGLSRVDAVIETYRRVAPAMTQTTIVGGLGLFVFALSTFTPTQRFGTLMLVLLVAALFGDLVLLPALLAGPAGRLFKPREAAEKSRDDTVVTTVDAASEQAAAITAGEGEEDGVTDKDSIPQLRVHIPKQRADGPHRVKRP